MELKNNARLELARRIVEQTDASLFLTGKAGTGKTTFLRELRDTSRKRIVVTAPTGIAAINAGGVTLHSFFQLDFGPFIPNMSKHGRFNRFNKEKLKIIRGMDLLIIDEVSMVRADLLDAVDNVLRRYRDRHKPFGGVQLLLIGDLQQLAPVVTEGEREILAKNYKSPYFFDSHALQELRYETVELNEVFRQNDQQFLEILNAIRENRADRSVLDRLNTRYDPDFNPDDSEGYIRLTTHNYQASVINNERMEALPAAEHIFDARVEGVFPSSSYPADAELKLKVGAQVMFIKNDTGQYRRYFNGMIGHVVAIDEECGVAVRPIEGGDIINVEPAEWDNIKFTVNEDTKEIVETTEGSFFQLPLRPAWAVTIHKSQGLTFDRAIIDARASFAHGQTYVALSRCRNMEGMVLSNKITHNAIINDSTVSDFMAHHNCEHIDDRHLSHLETAYRIHLLDELFSFRSLLAAMEGIVRLYQENFARIMPQMAEQWREASKNADKTLVEVADKFRQQYSALVARGDDSDETLQQRIKAAAKYFLGQLKPLNDLSISAVRTHGNKKVAAKITERFELFDDLLLTKRLLLDSFCHREFNVNIYLDLKADAMLRNSKVSDSVVPPRKKRALTPPRVTPHDTRSDEDAYLDEPDPIYYRDPMNFSGNVNVPQRKKVKKEKTVKEPKAESWQISLEMFNNGMSPREIAEERNLKTNTIMDHLLNHLDSEKAMTLVRDSIDPDTLNRIQSYLDSTPELPATLTAIREAIGGDPEWDHIRMMMQVNHRTLGKPQIVSEPEADYGTTSDFLD